MQRIVTSLIQENFLKIDKKYNLTILSDEIYSELSFKDNYKSISHFHKNTIVSSSLSKWAGAGGWRVGYFV